MEDELKEKERCKKVSFINEDFALQYIKKLKETSTRTKVPSRAYLCEVCLNWHLTSKGEYLQKKKKNKLKQKPDLIIKFEIGILK